MYMYMYMYMLHVLYKNKKDKIFKVVRVNRR